MRGVGAQFKTDKKQNLWRCFSKRCCVCNNRVQAGGQLGKRREGNPFGICSARHLCLSPSQRTATRPVCDGGFARTGVCPGTGHPWRSRVVSLLAVGPVGARLR